MPIVQEIAEKVRRARPERQNQIKIASRGEREARRGGGVHYYCIAHTEYMSIFVQPVRHA